MSNHLTRPEIEELLDAATPHDWKIEGTWRGPDGSKGFLISAGINSFGDGPDFYVGRCEISEEDARLICATKTIAATAIAAMEELRRQNDDIASVDNAIYMGAVKAAVKMRKQRDELLAALKDCTSRLETAARAAGNSKWAIEEMLSPFRAVIAKAGGQEPDTATRAIHDTAEAFCGQRRSG